MEEEGKVGRDTISSASSFFPVRVATGVVKLFDWGISSMFRFSLYIYGIVVGRNPFFIEDIIRERVTGLTAENETLKAEKEKLLRRLSKMASAGLRDNNPNIADLDDQYRPTKLAEMFSELYDNEWTVVYSVFEARLGEEKSIVNVLLRIMVQAYDFCEETVAGPWEVVTKWFLDMNQPGSRETSKWLKDSRKANIRNKIPEVLKEFQKDLMNIFEENNIVDLLEVSVVNNYMEKCVELSLHMVTTDPPVVMMCPSLGDNCDDARPATEQLALIGSVNSNKDKDIVDVPEDHVRNVEINESMKKDNVFDKDLFKEYTHRGKYVEYIVWPALLLHKNGPLLSKGIAQGTDISVISNYSNERNQ